MILTQKIFPRALRANLRGDESGAAAVEFALISTVLLMLLLAAIDCAWAIGARMEVGNAARAGTEFAAINGWNNAGIVTAATSATSLSVSASASNYCGCETGTSVTPQTCGSTCASGATAGSYVSVTATSTYKPILSVLWTSYLSGANLNLSATSVTRVQ